MATILLILKRAKPVRTLSMEDGEDFYLSAKGYYIIN
jgi:hypothetical protein